MSKRQRTKYPGVYQREAERVHGSADVAYDITYKVEGKKIWEKVGWKSQGYTVRLAKAVRDERIRSVLHGDELPKNRQKVPSFSEAAEKYLEWAEKNKARKGIMDKINFEKRLRDEIGGKRLHEISSFDLERIKAKLQKEELAPATVKHVLVLVRMIFNKAIQWGDYKGDNPIKGVKLPRPQNERQRFLTHKEATALLDELTKRSPQLHDMTLISLHCGLRAGEIFNLRGQDIDYQSGTLHVSDPKNKHPRQAFMTERVMEILRARRPENPGDFVFKSTRDGKIESVSTTFDRAVKALGFNDRITDSRHKVIFHTCRHTFCSWLASQGTPLHVIAELAGHRTLAMTQRYAHLIPDVKKAAIRDMEATFNESRPDSEEKGNEEPASLEALAGKNLPETKRHTLHLRKKLANDTGVQEPKSTQGNRR